MSSKRITQETDVESLDESLKGGRRFQRYFSCEQCPNDDISRSYQILIQEDGSNILFFRVDQLPKEMIMEAFYN